MPLNMNKAILAGYVGKDPEVKYTQNGNAVCNFSLATNKNIKKGDEWQKVTTWHNIVVWGKLAEKCGEFLKKGSAVLVEGEITNRSWDDKDGNKRYVTEIVAFLVQRSDNDQKPQDKPQKPKQTTLPTEHPQSPADDDIPF